MLQAAGYSLHPLAVDKLSVAECVLGSYWCLALL